MSVEVPCPQCNTILRAPPGMAGAKARCKKCQHAFRLPAAPGEELATPLPGEESTQLSVVDQPAFTFAAPETDVDSDPTPRSRGKYKTASSTTVPAKRSSTGSRRQANQGKSGTFLLLFGIAAVVIAGGVGAYFYTNQSKPDTPVASATKPPEKDKEPLKKSDKDAAKNKDDAKPDRKAKEQSVNAVVPPVSPKAGSETKPKKAAVAVGGGTKFPPMPTKAEKFTKPTVKLNTENAYTAIRQITVTGGDSPLAIVVWASDAGFQGKGAKDTVDRYNLDSGTRIDSTEIDSDTAAWPRALDISPNGENCISEGPAGTLTLYDLGSKKKSETCMPFKPFVVEDAKAPVPVLAAVYFADDKSIIAIAKNGLTESWNLRDGKKTNNSSIGAAGDYVAGRSLGIKPDRTSLLAVVNETVHEVNTKSLATRSVLTLPKGSDKCYAVGYADSGDRVAVAYRAATPGPHTLLAVGRIGEPKVNSYHWDESVGIPELIDWVGPECFITGFDKNGTALAFETEVNKPLATLWPQGGKAKHASYHGKHYVLIPDPADAKKCLLIGVDFPPDDYLPLRNEAVEAKAPVGFLLTVEGLGR